MGKQRRSYSEEFKQEAVRVASTGDRSLSQVARELGIDRSLLQKWKSGSRPSNGDDTPISAESLAEENRRLRRENASLREDREILKQFAAFSAKELR